MYLSLYHLISAELSYSMEKAIYVTDTIKPNFVPLYWPSVLPCQISIILIQYYYYFFSSTETNRVVLITLQKKYI